MVKNLTLCILAFSVFTACGSTREEIEAQRAKDVSEVAETLTNEVNATEGTPMPSDSAKVTEPTPTPTPQKSVKKTPKKKNRK